MQISQAIQIIIENKGQITIKEICNSIHITERTFERRFLKEVGISTKQFSAIIQFQLSLQQLMKLLQCDNHLKSLGILGIVLEQSHQ